MSHRGTRVSYIYSYQIILFENEIKIIKNWSVKKKNQKTEHVSGKSTIHPVHSKKCCISCAFRNCGWRSRIQRKKSWRSWIRKKKIKKKKKKKKKRRMIVHGVHNGSLGGKRLKSRRQFHTIQRFGTERFVFGRLIVAILRQILLVFVLR